MTYYRYFDSTEQMLCEGWPLVYSGKWKWEFKLDGAWSSNTYGPNSAGNTSLVSWRLASVEEQVEEPEYGWRERVHKMEERLDALETAVSAHAERITGIETAQTGENRVLDERLDALETKIGNQDAAVHLDYITALNKRVMDLEAWRDGLGDRAPGDPPWSDPPQQEADDKRHDAGQILLNAAQEFWDACHAEGQYGAVQWLQGTAGELLIYTRGEYKDQLMKNIDSLPSSKEHFFKTQEARGEFAPPCTINQAKEMIAKFDTEYMGQPAATLWAWAWQQVRSTDREVWMRPIYGGLGEQHQRLISDGGPAWAECSPDDEGAVKFWKEGE